MEAMNIALVPGLALFFGFPHNRLELLALGVASVSTAAFLLVGTFYWRGVERRARLGDLAALDHALRFAGRIEFPALMLSVIAALVTCWGSWTNGWSASIFASAALVVLSALEYINYYHWQLQIFDHAADFRRMITTRRLKRAHMGRELARMRHRDRA